jgi:hypothetical protein
MYSKYCSCLMLLCVSWVEKVVLYDGKYSSCTGKSPLTKSGYKWLNEKNKESHQWRID